MGQWQVSKQRINSRQWESNAENETGACWGRRCWLTFAGKSGRDLFEGCEQAVWISEGKAFQAKGITSAQLLRKQCCSWCVWGPSKKACVAGEDWARRRMFRRWNLREAEKFGIRLSTGGGASYQMYAFQRSLWLQCGQSLTAGSERGSSGVLQPQCRLPNFQEFCEPLVKHNHYLKIELYKPIIKLY